MKGLQADDHGFLVGSPIELTDLHDELVHIGDELSSIKGILLQDRPISIAQGSLNRLVSVVNAEANGHRDADNRTSVAVPVPRQVVSESHASENMQQRDTSISDRLGALQRSQEAAEKITETIKVNSIATPQSRNSRGQFERQDRGNSLRDEKGRFIAGAKDKAAEDKNTVPAKIATVGKGIVGAIGALAPQQDEADPSVKAMGEVTQVFSPVGRGLGKLFTTSPNGVSRGQDRWYRRFFKQNAEKQRTDDIADKREQQLLRNIEKKEGADSSSGSGFIVTLLLAFMGALGSMLLKGFHALAAPLRLLSTLLGPLAKVLQTLARVVGMGKLAEKLGSPTARTRRGPSTTTPTRAGERVPAGAKAGAKGVLKKLPLIGALISAGFLTKDLSDISASDESKEVKTKQVGSAVGSTAGSLGGMAAGGAAGAAIGSVVPVVGTIAGGIIGSILGGLTGEKVGGMLGDKFGDWVNDLRSSGFIDNMSRNWEIGVTAMGIMWNDFTNLSSSAWGSMVSGVQSGWANVTGFTQLMWQGVSNSFGSTTSFMQQSWATATAVVGGVLNSVWNNLGLMATAVTDSVKAYTGIDLVKNFNDLKNTVGGWVEGLKTTVSGVSSNLKDSLSSWSSNLFGGYFGNVFNQATGMVDNSHEANSTTKEQDANQTGVLNAFLKAGFSKSQAVALTAEVGRENNYNSKNLYGYHKDEANGAINMGMISWQGERAERLQAYMQQRGLIKDGKMVRSQAALDAQAEFVKQEIDSGKYAATQKLFQQKNLDPEAYAKTLGTDYVRWAYGQDVLKSGKRFNWKSHDNRRRGHKQTALAKTNVSIPYRVGYTPPANKTGNPKEVPATTDNNMVATAMPTGEVDPNSVEGMLQAVNGFDGMANIKTAVVAMLKDASEGKIQAKAHIRNTAAVPAAKVPSAAPISDAPKVELPIMPNTSKDSNASIEDVSRNLSDPRIAHIVTGGYFTTH